MKIFTLPKVRIDSHTSSYIVGTWTNSFNQHIDWVIGIDGVVRCEGCHQIVAEARLNEWMQLSHDCIGLYKLLVESRRSKMKYQVYRYDVLYGDFWTDSQAFNFLLDSIEDDPQAIWHIQEPFYISWIEDTRFLLKKILRKSH